MQVRNLDFGVKLFERNSEFLSRALATTYRNAIDKERKKTSDVFVENKKLRNSAATTMTQFVLAF